MCVLYGAFASNGFVTKVQPFPMDGHYRTDIISSVGHPRLDLVVPLVLCMVACNACDIGIVLQVRRDSANPTKWCINGGKASFGFLLKLHVYFCIIKAHVIPKL
jgi:hypothetical protein